LLHHRPTLARCRPSASAGPAGMLPGARGSRLLDRRPPHYRCPAVPGLESPARAILTVPGSSVLPSVISHLPNGYCVLHGGLRERHPPAARPVARPALAQNPLPNFPVRAPAADAFTGVLLTDFTAARQFIPARPCCLSGLREKPYPTQPPNVYSSKQRFYEVLGRGNLPGSPWEASSAVKACPGRADGERVADSFPEARRVGAEPGPGAAAAEGPAAGAPARRPHGNSVPVVVRRAGRVPEPPLRAGPVRVVRGPPSPDGRKPLSSRI
jgi:hypothetical protein